MRLALSALLPAWTFARSLSTYFQSLGTQSMSTPTHISDSFKSNTTLFSFLLCCHHHQHHQHHQLLKSKNSILVLSIGIDRFWRDGSYFEMFYEKYNSKVKMNLFYPPFNIYNYSSTMKINY
ncbi:hypothetical protein ACTFIW_003454 [Dictyostelium discoideum]